MNHILIVEDDENIAIVMRRLVEVRLGLRASVTGDPEEALAILARDPACGIIMDVSLKDARLAGSPCDGVRLARHIRQHPTFAKLPIVLATAHAMKGDAERLMQESGADAYVTKPFESSQSLIEPLRKLLAA